MGGWKASCGDVGRSSAAPRIPLWRHFAAIAPSNCSSSWVSRLTGPSVTQPHSSRTPPLRGGSLVHCRGAHEASARLRISRACRAPSRAAFCMVSPCLDYPQHSLSNHKCTMHRGGKGGQPLRQLQGRLPPSAAWLLWARASTQFDSCGPRHSPLGPPARLRSHPGPCEPLFSLKRCRPPTMTSRAVLCAFLAVILLASSAR